MAIILTTTTKPTITMASADHSSGMGNLTGNQEEENVGNDITDLFSHAPVEKDTMSRIHSDIWPLNTVAAGSPYIFDIVPMASDLYLKADACVLVGTVRVVRANGNQLPAGENVSIVNTPISSLFDSVKVSLNGVTASDLDSDHHNYKTYLETILSHGWEAAHTHLQCQRFEMDDADHFGVVSDGSLTWANPDGNGTAEELANHPRGTNRGFNHRARLIAESNEFDFAIPISVDFLQTPRLIPPGVQINLVFHRSAAHFPILAPVENINNYKVQITDLRLVVQHIRLSSQAVAHHHSLLNSGKDIIIPFKKTKIRTYNIPPGLREQRIVAVFSGILPRSYYLFQVDARASTGSKNYNPFNFQHFNMHQVAWNIRGIDYPKPPYDLNFNDNNPRVVPGYRHLMESVGISQNDDRGNMVTLNNFAAGCTIIGMDFR